MSSWIKLIDNIEKRSHPRKSIHRDIASTTNIEDDSSQESCNLTSPSSAKKRKIGPLEDLTIETEVDSSDDCCDVEYNPDGVQLPNTGKRKIKKALTLVPSVATHRSSIIGHGSSTTERTHPWTKWMTIPQSNQQTDVSFQIEDSMSDSNESSSHTLIDESSTDSSPIQSPIGQQHETMIETEESITPPVAPFTATTTKLPKKSKVRMKKGGLVEQLKKSLSQAKSNLLFWHHHRSAELIPPGTLVTVNRVENTYGRTLVHVKVNDEATIFSLCSSALEVQEGDSIEVKFDTGRSYKTDTHLLYSYVDKVLLIKKDS